MSSTWGNHIKLSLFGESHGNGIGIVIDGLPPGIKLDLDEIKAEMKRRAPGRNATTTPRKEKDAFEIISGFYDHKTTGTPLCCLIKNENTKSRDYDKMKTIMRPGHADYTGFIKYKGFNDIRGGGHFSGRLTAPLVFAGAVCKQILKTKKIYIGSHIAHIAGIQDRPFDRTHLSAENIQTLKRKELNVLDDNAGQKMQACVLKAKAEKDSVGGVIETAIINVPAGLGSPFFDSIESRLASMIFSIPAVKGIEFGSGFHIAHMKGSESNDAFINIEGEVKTQTNHNGGILGGISNGMPIIFKTAFKPTASIGKKQETINIETMEDTEIEVQGRHDPCIVFRAVPVTEAAAAIVVLDILMEKEAI